MRITMKGGVWKNSEDEILKAAVMKYGLNNWSRVASLLVRKSAKQCKARWYEWLDPSVKKTEWSRDEEAKLLHLAKLFPTQWRTIAPIIGRTAHQCLEHYDKLLDQAQGKDIDDMSDPRRLRPGEIDPHPETKPSRADAVDMEDDEKEMLAEARARLANTRGKKAKRKAREKQLEEARRLASLQKRRELKAAGIQIGKWKRKAKHGIDYGTEIPFEEQPPKGFYMIGADETPESSLSFANVSLQQLEGQRRTDEELRLRREDKRKLKRMMDDNLPEAMALIEKLNDPQSFRKRTKMTLPSAQLTDADLDEILQLNSETLTSLGGSGMDHLPSSHSNQLLNEEKKRDLPSITPIRTPMVDNTIAQEAQNAVARLQTQTPLEGGDNPSLHTIGSVSTGITPFRSEIRTPNPLALSLRGSGAVASSMLNPSPSIDGRQTPASSMGQTPLEGSAVDGYTPLRDVLSLNDMGSQGVKAREALLRMQIRSSLSNLPQPLNEVEIAMPDIVIGDGAEMMEKGKVEEEEDMEVREMKEREKEKERLAIEFRKQNSVIQRELPRPYFSEKSKFEPSGYERLGTGTDGKYLAEGEELLHQEMLLLIKSDAVKHPLAVKGLRVPRLTAPLESYELDELGEGAALLELETSLLEEQSDLEGLDVSQSSAARKAWDEALTQTFIYSPESKSYVPISSVSQKERLDSLKASFDELKQHLSRESAKAKKVEQKLSLLTSGYVTRAEGILKATESYWSDLNASSWDFEGFKGLRDLEDVAIVSRKAYLSSLLNEQKMKHDHLQKCYALLLNRREELRSQVVA